MMPEVELVLTLKKPNEKKTSGSMVENNCTIDVHEVRLGLVVHQPDKTRPKTKRQFRDGTLGARNIGKLDSQPSKGFGLDSFRPTAGSDYAKTLGGMSLPIKPK
jgi:hypothetical protein